MLTKTQKQDFVKGYSAQLSKHSVVGIVPLSGIPDRLLQSARNSMKGKTTFILGRKTLLKRILESNEKTKALAKELSNTSAIVLSNEDPFVLYGQFKAGSIKLAAKPGQIAPQDVSIQAGETSIQPGQTVTELKSAGIDVQIQKGKVVIAKDKVVAKMGEPISGPIAKALRILDIMPFKAALEPAMLLSGGTLFTRAVLGIDTQKTVSDIGVAFNSALALSLERGIVNAYTIKVLIGRAFRNAYHLGVEAKLYDSGVIEGLLARAAGQAAALNSLSEKK